MQWALDFAKVFFAGMSVLRYGSQTVATGRFFDAQQISTALQ
jgi:hypothetical protein